MNAWKSSIAGTERPLRPASNQSTAGKQRPSVVSKAVATAPCPAVLPAVVAPPRQVKQHSEHDIFVCDEESHFYSQCIDRLLLRAQRDGEMVIEFGSGDGTPVLNSLKQTAQSCSGLTIHGYELNPTSAALAQANATACGLESTYQVHNSCFFKGAREMACSTLVANPPYIPAPDDDILMPALHGGVDGANLTRDLMSMGFDTAVLLISAYANPVETMEHARRLGYRCTDFMVTPLPFGYYSSEPKVRNWISRMKEEGKAFYRGNTYLLAGVRLQKQATCKEAVEPVSKSRAGGADGKAAQRSVAQFTANNIVPRPAQSATTSGFSEQKFDTDLTDELLSVLTAF